MRFPYRGQSATREVRADCTGTTCTSNSLRHLDSCLAENASSEEDMQSLEQAFDVAASRLEHSAGSGGISQDDLLELYGLYKQSTCGQCDTFRPSFFDIKGRSKWAAWKNLDGLPQDAAKLLYIDKVHKLLGDTEDFKEAGAGPVISTLGDDALEAEEDVPEWDSLHIQASQGNMSSVERLLENGADINARDSEGCTALHWACDRGCLMMVKKLLDSGADPHVCDLDGQLPAQYALLSGHQKVVDLIGSLEYQQLLQTESDSIISDC